jgi:DNA helicase HerA-like ATPase
MLDLPLEYALIAFEGDRFSGKIVPELLDLAQRGVVRFVDLVFIQKEADGNTRTLELNDLDPETYEIFVPVGEHVASLFTNDDLEIAASRLPSGSAGLLVLWENLWVANLRQAIGDAGGQLVERKQIAPEVVEEYMAGLATE